MKNSRISRALGKRSNIITKNNVCKNQINRILSVTRNNTESYARVFIFFFKNLKTVFFFLFSIQCEPLVIGENRRENSGKSINGNFKTYLSR